MGAEIIPFEFDSGAVRTVLIEDQPWFVAADVCRALEIGNTAQASFSPRRDLAEIRLR